MKRDGRWLRFVFAGLGSLVLGCFSLPPFEAGLEPVFGEEARVAAWIERARIEGEQRYAVRAYGRVRLKTDGASGRFREVVAVQRPDRLRFETLNFLGQTQSLLTTDGERFSFFDGQRIERGRAPRGLLSDRLGLDLEPAEAIALLLAAPPLSREPPRRIFAQGQGRVVEFAEQRVRFHQDGSVLGVESFDPGGELRWAAEYSNWRELPEGRYPMSISFQFPRTAFRIEIALEEVSLNPELDGALFRTAPARQE